MLTKLWLRSAVLPFLSGVSASRKPNIVMILTDDQDVHMHSLDYMPFVQKYLMNEGTTFTRHYCTIAVCCPSRASLLTGMTAHNTNVTDIIMPYGKQILTADQSYPSPMANNVGLGGYPKWVDEGLNDDYLPLWLQDAGYSTYYVGKLFNQHDVSNYADYPSKGWTQSDFLLDPCKFSFLRAGVYTTTLTARRYLRVRKRAFYAEWTEACQLQGTILPGRHGG